MTKRTPLDALVRALRWVHETPDPTDRLARLALVRVELETASAETRALIRSTIVDLRAAEPPPTWAEIGAVLGVTAQRAEQLAHVPPQEKGGPS